MDCLGRYLNLSIVYSICCVVWPLYSLEALLPYVLLAPAFTVGLNPQVLANNHLKICIKLLNKTLALL